MAISPRNTDDAFAREVDEGVRADQLANFWRRYGIALVAVVVIGLAALGSWLWWREEQVRRAGVAGEGFTQALAKLEIGDTPSAAPLLQKLATDGAKGYAPLATMMLAGTAVTSGDTAKAVRLYDQVAADASVAQPLRDAATIKSVRRRYDELKPADVVKRLAALSVPGNPWFPVAGEMTALAHLKAGDTARAATLLTAIVREPGASPNLRERAAQLAQSLGVDPKTLAAPTVAPAQ